MDAREAAIELISEYDGSRRSLTSKMGYAPGYLNSVLKRGSMPSSNTLAKIADACDYDLLLRRRMDDYEILIEPTDE